MKQLRCAIIGCGRIGCGFDDNSKGTVRTHAGSYSKNPNTELIALCDVDRNKLKKYGKKYKINRLYQKSEDLFLNETLDCISICTLVDSHLKLVNEAVKGGVKGIFLEKPISNDLKSAKKIIELCKRKNIKLLIDHQRRYDPNYQNLAKIIQNGDLGKIQHVNCYYGAGVANTGSHLFDILRFFFGEVNSIKSQFSKNLSNNKNDPNIDCELKFFNELCCNITALNYLHYGLFELDIFGSGGRLRLDLKTGQFQFFKPKTEFIYKTLQPIKTSLKSSSYSPIQYGVNNLVGCILKNEKPSCTGNDGYKSLELIIASIKSAKKNKEILLPLSHDYTKINSR